MSWTRSSTSHFTSCRTVTCAAAARTVIGLHAVIADKRYRYGLEERLAQLVLELCARKGGMSVCSPRALLMHRTEHPRVVIPGFELRTSKDASIQAGGEA